MRSGVRVWSRRRARSVVASAVLALLLIAVLGACDAETVGDPTTLIPDKAPKHDTTSTTTAPPTTTTTAPSTTTTTAPSTTTTTTTTAPSSTTTTTTPAGSGSTLFADNFESSILSTTWLDGASVGGWTSIYNGYGLNDVELDGTKTMSESPRPSTSPNETHAGLVVTNNNFGDFDATVRIKTVQQMRIGSAPNPWEVGWVLWHHTDDTHFYYFVPKPNGWELGKEDPAYPGAQRYLATASTPTFPVGQWYTVRIRQVASTIVVWVNGAQVTTFSDSQRPYLTGHLGLYNEDSHVRFDDVTVNRP